MKKYFLVFLIAAFPIVGVIVWKNTSLNGGGANLFKEKQIISSAVAANSPFYHAFSANGVLNEAGKSGDSLNPYWWLNSGGQFYFKDGIGKTVQGKLGKLNKWRLAYAASNPADTDNGYRPQNILRLVTKSKWQDFQQEAYFKIIKLNMSASRNRNASNGVLLFNRYQDGNNLYYAGIRVDGAAVIKKKINGVYYTLAQKSFYNASAPYNRDIDPNFIPAQKWIGLKSEIKTNPDNTVSIKLFIDKDKTGNSVLAVEAKDDGKIYGGAAILKDGYAGIRTDFMDAEFDGYKIVEIISP